MAIPFFYHAEYLLGDTVIVPEENTGKHMVQVLRMIVGDQVHITNGLGYLVRCEIIEVRKKDCTLKVLESHFQEAPARKTIVAISLVKNPSRWEWFLEKATEIGLTEIIPLRCQRTEKEKFRHDRLQQICISAMLQSQQTWLPILHEPQDFKQIDKWHLDDGKNFIAHCEPDKKQELKDCLAKEDSHRLIAIGPEGDFTPEEINLALDKSFLPVSLGNTRLRTETAGVVAATLLQL